MAQAGFAHNPLLCNGEEFLLSFTVTGNATPEITSDPDKLVTSLTDTAAGKITVNLAHRYKTIRAWANCQKAAGEFVANVIPTAGMDVDNTLLVLTYDTDATAALGDTSAIIDVFMLVRMT